MRFRPALALLPILALLGFATAGASPEPQAARAGASTLAAQTAPRPALGNLLANPSFEEGARYWRDNPTKLVASGWEPWWKPRTANSPDYTDWEPEFRPVSNRPGQSTDGVTSQTWFNVYAIHTAGIYQRVSGIQPGTTLLFCLSFYTWTSAADVFGVSDPVAQPDDPATPTGKVPTYKQVGIDPTGGTDPFAPQVVWSPVALEQDVWVARCVTATAAGDSATVFARTRPQWALKHNDTLVDRALLMALPPLAALPEPRDPDLAAWRGANPALQLDRNDPIARSWLERRAAGRFDGRPLSPVFPLRDGKGITAQVFENGIAMWQGGDLVEWR